MFLLEPRPEIVERQGRVEKIRVFFGFPFFRRARTEEDDRGVFLAQGSKQFAVRDEGGRDARQTGREARLMPIVTGNARGDDAPGRSRRPIQLGPGLLVYLDALKRRQFLDAWRSSVEPKPR